MIGFIKRILLLIEYAVKKYIDYLTKVKSPFRLPIRWFSLGLLTELGEIFKPGFLDPIYRLLILQFGEIKGTIIEAIIEFILQNYSNGFSLISISIKTFMLILLCFFEWSRENKEVINLNFFSNINLFNRTTKVYGSKWEVTKKWFDNVNESNLSNIIKQKYDNKLHIKSSAEKSIENNIIDFSLTKREMFLSLIENQLTKISSLQIEIQKLKEYDNQENELVLNKNSVVYEELQEIDSSLVKIIKDLSSLKNAINNDLWLEFIECNITQLPDFSIPRNKLGSFINDNRFDLFIKNESEKYSGIHSNIFRRNMFEAFLPLLFLYYDVHQLSDSILSSSNEIKISKSYLVHSIGGVGKTHFSINLFNSLHAKGLLPIFLKGQSFSGGDYNIHSVLKKILDLPGHLTNVQFFDKLNDYAQNEKKKIVIIIDGLNESTHLGNGFSPIWQNGLPNLFNSINQLKNIFIVVTCRSSYAKQFHKDKAKYNLLELKGFDSEELRIEAIKTYFEYYKIKIPNLYNYNLDFFEVPLFLSFFCKISNPNISEEISVSLDNQTYESVLNSFIEYESNFLSDKLDRPTNTAVQNAINRSSIKFKEELSGILDIDTYFEETDNMSIDIIKKSTSIAFHLLQDELLFIKEIIPSLNQEMVVHTFQNIGGFLIAQSLIKEFESAKELVNSEFYKNHLEGAISGKYGGPIHDEIHQLANDILKFLVIAFAKKNDELVEHTNDKLVQEYTWQFIFDNPKFEEKEKLIKRLKLLLVDEDGWYALLETSLYQFVDTSAVINFSFISNILKEPKLFLFDKTWTRFIYENWVEFQNIVHDTDGLIENHETIENNDEIFLRLELIVWLQETTIRELRDKATRSILEYSTNYPEFIFKKVIEFSNVNRPYIYERLAGICYGVCLRKQNDNEFINGVLKEFAPLIYDLQFSEAPISPVYNYIVIDSFKHILDLAIKKGVIDFSAAQLERLSNYQFNISEEWLVATDDDKKQLKPHVSDWSFSGIDPLRGDFYTYTIPRLVKKGVNNYLNAIANVYKRIFHLGYETIEYDKESMSSSFIHGNKPYGIKSKVERLGKKYCWLAFFDYAGYLLNRGELNSIYKGDTSVEAYYDRLSDVEIEVSSPKPKVYKLQLFKDDLLVNRNENNAQWVYEEKYKLSVGIWNYAFDDGGYTLAHGYLGQKFDKEYKVRSYLLLKSFLVKKSDLKGREAELVNRDMDWRKVLYVGGISGNCYFGELYWADTVAKVKTHEDCIETENESEYERVLDFRDVAMDYPDKNVGDTIKIRGKESICFTLESTVVEYSWESDSEIYPSLRDYIPSPNMGRHLGLKADAINFQILDNDNKLAFRTIKYDDSEKIDQSLNYIRTDLLNKYMEENDLVLLYQIQQHTYDRLAGDGNGDFRGMKFFFPHLGNQNFEE